MNKVELIAKLAEKAGMTKAAAEQAFDSVFEVVKEALAEGEKVVVTGFGTFEVKERVAREVINPQTHLKIKVPGFKAATFKAGKLLKEAVK